MQFQHQVHGTFQAPTYLLELKSVQVLLKTEPLMYYSNIASDTSLYSQPLTEGQAVEQLERNDVEGANTVQQPSCMHLRILYK